MTDHAELDVVVEHADGVAVVSPTGVLDSSTYLRLRDELVKAGADGPDAVLAAVDGLTVPTTSAWSVLTSARWTLGRWPGTALCVTATDPRTRRQLQRNGIARYVPVYESRSAALCGIGCGEYRRYRMRANATLARDRMDAAVARRLVSRMVDGLVSS